MTVAAVLLAGGTSQRLGQPKQLLRLRGRPLLQHSVDAALAAGAIDLVVVALGHAADEIEAAVDLTGCRVARSASFSQGCAGSLAAGMSALDDAAPDGVVLLTGDQPAIDPDVIDQVVATGLAGAMIAVCRYDDQFGHPFWFASELIGELRSLGGDKAAWKLIASSRWPVATVAVAGLCPPDVDTWDDYHALLAGDGA